MKKETTNTENNQEKVNLPENEVNQLHERTEPNQVDDEDDDLVSSIKNELENTRDFIKDRIASIKADK